MLKIMTFNIRYGSAADGDLLGIQECRDDEQAEFVRHSLPGNIACSASSAAEIAAPRLKWLPSCFVNHPLKFSRAVSSGSAHPSSDQSHVPPDIFPGKRELLSLRAKHLEDDW
jgi:hypothetical protein